MNEETNERFLKADREWQITVNAFHRVFKGGGSSEDAARVLTHLAHKFDKAGSAFMPPAPGTPMDPILGAWRDGAKKPLLYIEWMLEQKCDGDANVEEPKLRVIS